MLNWSNPLLLKNYGSAPRGQGIYCIGKAINQKKLVEACGEYDAYLGTWPSNMQPLYVGISESNEQGVRGRLSSHARCKGNKGISAYIGKRVELWFTTISGTDFAKYEAGLLALQTNNQFECNIRSELKRSAKRQHDMIRAATPDHELEFYDNLDMGEHGEGM